MLRLTFQERSGSMAGKLGSRNQRKCNFLNYENGISQIFFPHRIVAIRSLAMLCRDLVGQTWDFLILSERIKVAEEDWLERGRKGSQQVQGSASAQVKSQLTIRYQFVPLNSNQVKAQSWERERVYVESRSLARRDCLHIWQLEKAQVKHT